MTIQYEPARLTVRNNDGATMAYVTFHNIRPGLVNVDRLQTLPGFRNTGAEETLMQALAEHLAGHGSKALVTCPFAQCQAAKDPRWKKLVPEKIHMTSH